MVYYMHNIYNMLPNSITFLHNPRLKYLLYLLNIFLKLHWKSNMYFYQRTLIDVKLYFPKEAAPGCIEQLLYSLNFLKDQYTTTLQQKN